MEYSVIFILPHAIVGMQVHIHFSMLLEEVIEHTDNCIGPLSRIAGYINEVVDLPKEGFTTYPKDSTLARSEEVDRAGLKRIRGVMHLLCHVEGIVDDRGQGAGYTF